MSDQKEQRKKEGEQRNWRPCCGTEGWKACCSTDEESGEGSGWCGEEMPNFMGRCFSAFRFFPLFPVLIGVCFLALGYLLSPETVRVLWMVGAGMFVMMGLFGLIVVGRIAVGIRSARH